MKRATKRAYATFFTRVIEDVALLHCGRDFWMSSEDSCSRGSYLIDFILLSGCVVSRESRQMLGVKMVSVFEPDEIFNGSMDNSLLFTPCHTPSIGYCIRHPKPVPRVSPYPSIQKLHVFDPSVSSAESSSPPLHFHEAQHENHVLIPRNMHQLILVSVDSRKDSQPPSSRLPCRWPRALSRHHLCTFQHVARYLSKERPATLGSDCRGWSLVTFLC